MAMNNTEAAKFLAEKFQDLANLGKGNNYVPTILEPRLAELDKIVKENYPDYYNVFVEMKNKYVGELKAKYQTNESVRSGESEEKKTNLGLMGQIQA